MKIEVLEQAVNKLLVLAEDDIKSKLNESFAILRATAIVHQHNHWEIGGQAQYGDHLLYERLYTATQSDIDSLAERIIGVCGLETLSFNKTLNNLQCNYLNSLVDRSILERSLLAEQKAKDILSITYESLKNSQFKSDIGLTEDLFPSLISNREEALYLLRRRAES
jgi:DNA-binding ferritin-like protein